MPPRGLISAGPTPEDSAIVRELEEGAAGLLGTLSALDRETILAMVHEREGRGGATFRKRLQRALVRLRSAWRLGYGAE